MWLADYDSYSMQVHGLTRIMVTCLLTSNNWFKLWSRFWGCRVGRFPQGHSRNLKFGYHARLIGPDSWGRSWQKNWLRGIGLIFRHGAQIQTCSSKTDWEGACWLNTRDLWLIWKRVRVAFQKYKQVVKSPSGMAQQQVHISLNVNFSF